MTEGAPALRFVLASAGTTVGLLAKAEGECLGLLVEPGRFAVLCMTDFGPSARVYEGGGVEQIVRVVSQSRGKVHTVFLSTAGDTTLLPRLRLDGEEATRHHGGTDIDGFDDAIAAFKAVRRPQPVARTDEDGNEFSLAWSVAPLVGDGIVRGGVLTARLAVRGRETVIGWFDESNRAVGIHLVVPRADLTSEESLLEGTTATVLEATYGLMPAAEGDRTVQTLMLEVPTRFARAFPDGKMPRHGGLELIGGMTT